MFKWTRTTISFEVDKTAKSAKGSNTFSFHCRRTQVNISSRNFHHFLRKRFNHLIRKFVFAVSESSSLKKHLFILQNQHFGPTEPSSSYQCTCLWCHHWWAGLADPSSRRLQLDRFCWNQQNRFVVWEGAEPQRPPGAEASHGGGLHHRLLPKQLLEVGHVLLTVLSWNTARPSVTAHWPRVKQDRFYILFYCCHKAEHKTWHIKCWTRIGPGGYRLAAVLDGGVCVNGWNRLSL